MFDALVHERVFALLLFHWCVGRRGGRREGPCPSYYSALASLVRLHAPTHAVHQPINQLPRQARLHHVNPATHRGQVAGNLVVGDVQLNQCAWEAAGGDRGEEVVVQAKVFDVAGQVDHAAG